MELRRSGSDTLGVDIRSARLGSGRSLTQVAAEIGTSKSYLSRLERGIITNPSAEMIHRLCVALGIQLTLGEASPRLAGGGLRYERPELNLQDSNACDAASVRALREALMDESISRTERELLDRQVQAMVKVLQAEKTSRHGGTDVP